MQTIYKYEKKVALLIVCKHGLNIKPFCFLMRHKNRPYLIAPNTVCAKFEQVNKCSLQDPTLTIDFKFDFVCNARK
jgi:hypothetical protein